MTKKRYVALARVSSREQEREGFSLEIQEEALDRYAKQHGGSIVKLFRIAETATKPDERRTFREFLAYAKKNASELTGLLFMKVDRAARNLFDYVELERLESECGLEVIYVTQPTENTPAGRMLRRTLANMASFYTEQQSVDVRGGLERRVQTGLFPNKRLTATEMSASTAAVSWKSTRTTPRRFAGSMTCTRTKATRSIR